MNVYKKGLVAAVASTMVFASVAGAPAFAQEGSAPAPAAAFTGTPNIPADWTTGNLYIHKFENEKPGTAGDGSEIKDTSKLGRAMADVKYTVIKLDGLDVRKNSDWQTFATFNTLTNNGALPEGVTEGTSTEVATDATGLAKAENLPIGFYKVVETVPEGYKATSNPFYVSVPMTNPSDRTSWMRDVHVYPKNQGPQDTPAPTKTVKDANKHAGDVISYEVKQTLPSTAETRQYGFRYYAIRDLFPQDRLKFPEGTAESAVGTVTVGGKQLTAGQDYYVQSDAEGNPVVVFAGEGDPAQLNKDTFKAGAEVVVKFNFEVLPAKGNDNGDLDAVVNNLNTYPVPGFDPSNPPTDDVPPPPTDTPPGDTPWEPPTDTPDEPEQKPNSYFGNAFLEKKDAATKEVIKGAEFSVYGGKCADVTSESEAIQTKTTGENGRADFYDLHANNFEDGKAVGDTQETPKSYCLVETKAAEGYELLAQPIDFQVLVEGQDADGNGGTVKAVNLTTDQNLTDNTRLHLPLTGGNGIWFVLAIGAILVAAGGAYSYAQRRNA